MIFKSMEEWNPAKKFAGFHIIFTNLLQVADRGFYIRFVKSCNEVAGYAY